MLQCSLHKADLQAPYSDKLSCDSVVAIYLHMRQSPLRSTRKKVALLETQPCKEAARRLIRSIHRVRVKRHFVSQLIMETFDDWTLMSKDLPEHKVSHSLEV